MRWFLSWVRRADWGIAWGHTSEFLEKLLYTVERDTEWLAEEIKTQIRELEKQKKRDSIDRKRRLSLIRRKKRT